MFSSCANDLAFGSLANLLNPKKSNVYQSGSITKINPSVVTNNQTITYSPNLINQSTSYDKSGRLIDFRKVLRENLRGTAKTKNTATGQLTLAPDYADYNVGKRNQLGNPGADRKNKNYSSYTRGVVYPGNKTRPLDEINASAVGANPSRYNDLVTFNICPLNNQNWMTFRAFLGSFTDSYNGAINTQQYVGRGENFYTYQGFTRKISLSWTVAALSKQELWKKWGDEKDGMIEIPAEKVADFNKELQDLLTAEKEINVSELWGADLKVAFREY